MKRLGTSWIACGGLLAFLAGCAGPKPPAELRDARAAYAQASRGQTAQLNPADLHGAEQSLKRAEASFDDDGDSQRTRDLAYLAERRVRIADARARTMAAEQQKAAAVAATEQRRNAALAQAQGQLNQTQEQLRQTQQARATEEERRVEAERRAKQAAEDLAKVASVKQEPRGMVVTLSGSVLFATGKSELLPAARARLTEVAKTLAQQDKESQIVVEGHTDSQGSEAFNDELSRKRAESVKQFLASNGIAEDRISAEGHGESRPVATNDSAEGRANNRRVEIVVQPAKTSTDGGEAPR